MHHTRRSLFYTIGMVVTNFTPHHHVHFFRRCAHHVVSSVIATSRLPYSPGYHPIMIVVEALRKCDSCLNLISTYRPRMFLSCAFLRSAELDTHYIRSPSIRSQYLCQAHFTTWNLVGRFVDADSIEVVCHYLGTVYHLQLLSITATVSAYPIYLQPPTFFLLKDAHICQCAFPCSDSRLALASHAAKVVCDKRRDPD